MSRSSNVSTRGIKRQAVETELGALLAGRVEKSATGAWAPRPYRWNRAGHMLWGVTPQELASIRKRLGLTPASLAAELNLTPGIVEAWESGRIGPSRRAEQWLIWRGAMLDRDEAVSASGLPECATLRAVATDATGGDGTKAARRRADAVLAHLANCPNCLARKRFLDERFPPMPPPPLPAALAVIVWAHGRIKAVRLRLRSWRKPKE